MWEAAFVGTGGNFTRNFIPAALVLINTFGSYIIIGFLLPTLHIAPFTIYAMFPSLANRKKEEDKDLSKGDLTLFEYDHVLLTSAFSVSCKYICYFAIRVSLQRFYIDPSFNPESHVINRMRVVSETNAMSVYFCIRYLVFYLYLNIDTIIFLRRSTIIENVHKIVKFN